MTRPGRSPSRRVAGLAAAGLVAALLPALGPLAPAGAAEGCLSEAHGLFLAGCDDSTPPETEITAFTPSPNAAGWVRESAVTVTFRGWHTDADTDPIAFECRLVKPGALSPAWSACTSPMSHSGLADTDDAKGYRFEVRAYDTADRPLNPGVPPLQPVSDTPDEDATPATRSWGQDTSAPTTFVTASLHDEETPDRPVTGSREVVIRLDTNEPGSAFECRDRGTPIRCDAGRYVLRNLTSGDHAITARAVDKAGNAGEWREPVVFTVPDNVRPGKGWRKRRGGEWFDGDAAFTRKKGARLVFKRRTTGEIRLYAATGPDHGKVRVKVGRTGWRVVNLRGPREARRELIVIDRYQGTRRGRVLIETMTRRKVFIDAIVLRDNAFRSGGR